MLIQLNNLPSDVTQDDIDALLDHMDTINSIRLVKMTYNDDVFALIELECSRVGLNAICNVLNGKYLGDHHIMAYPSLYSH